MWLSEWWRYLVPWRHKVWCCPRQGTSFHLDSRCRWNLRTASWCFPMNSWNRTCGRLWKDTGQTGCPQEFCGRVDICQFVCLELGAWRGREGILLLDCGLDATNKYRAVTSTLCVCVCVWWDLQLHCWGGCCIQDWWIPCDLSELLSSSPCEQAPLFSSEEDRFLWLRALFIRNSIVALRVTGGSVGYLGSRNGVGSRSFCTEPRKKQTSSVKSSPSIQCRKFPGRKWPAEGLLKPGGVIPALKSVKKQHLLSQILHIVYF